MEEGELKYNGRNYYKIFFLGTIIFVVLFVTIREIIPPEYSLCNVAATGLSLFAREHAKENAF